MGREPPSPRSSSPSRRTGRRVVGHVQVAGGVRRPGRYVRLAVVAEHVAVLHREVRHLPVDVPHRVAALDHHVLDKPVSLLEGHLGLVDEPCLGGAEGGDEDDGQKR